MNQLDGRPPLHWKRWVRKRVPAIKSLIAALSDEEREVRLAAVSALSRIGIPAQRAAPALIKLIELGGMSKDDSSEVDDAGIVLDDYEDVRWAGWEADVRSIER